ncbi:hypothetical protein B5807_11633 [Epicoccum nigrum]|uniref:Uncharacterized protein n=1 Tax=Epicoccum nigrum TaxID=105696 RepID=A0A1Y2LJQ6_EPING|nr:hypothetical protein B5807_11633 [Epicoccum nigrum]
MVQASDKYKLTIENDDQKQHQVCKDEVERDAITERNKTSSPLPRLPAELRNEM